ncbi:DUF6888 family protein [Nostoc sp.]
MIPTPEQKTQCYILLCCWFTKLYLSINIVRIGLVFDF